MRFLAILAMGLLTPAAAIAGHAPTTATGDAFRTLQDADKATGAEQVTLLKRAMAAFRAECAKNDAFACEKIVETGYMTKHLPDDQIGPVRADAARRAAAAWDRQCRDGGIMLQNGPCMRLARLVRYVHNRDGDYPALQRTDGLISYRPLAAQLMLKGCEAGNNGETWECVGASDLLVDLDPDRARKLHATLCARDDMRWACHRMGRLTKVEQAEMDRVARLCGQGDGKACFDGGYYYYSSAKTVAGSIGLARSLFEKSCAARYAGGCLGVAQIIVDQNPADQDAAGRYLDQACKIDPGAQPRLCAAAGGGAK